MLCEVKTILKPQLTMSISPRICSTIRGYGISKMECWDGMFQIQRNLDVASRIDTETTPDVTSCRIREIQ